MSNRPITLEIPADSANISLVRSTTMAVAARTGLTIEQLDEVRLAAGEMCTLLLEDTPTENSITVVFDTKDKSTISVKASAVTERGRVPRTDSFAWTILTALVDEASATAEDGIVTISMSRKASHLDSDADGNSTNQTGAALS